MIFFMFEIDLLWFFIMFICIFINKWFWLVNIILFIIFVFLVWKKNNKWIKYFEYDKYFCNFLKCVLILKMVIYVYVKFK